MLTEKETLEKVYQQLLEDHRTLQTSYDDIVSEKDDTLSRLRDLQRNVDDQRSQKADVFMRTEIDRLRVELCVGFASASHSASFHILVAIIARKARRI